MSTLASVEAYQLLYRTTDAAGAPIATVTTLLLPAVPAPGRRKLVSYHTAEDSLTTRCAPSYTLRSGSGTTQSAESGEIAPLLARGWDVVVPDYEGRHSEWAVGRLEGQAALDSVRAVEQFRPAHLEGSRTPVVMMGYSGGSIPTVWGNALARSYAPELNLVGVAAGGIVPNPAENLAAVDGTFLFGTVIGLSVAVDRGYPELDLDTLLNSRGRALAQRDGRDADGCAGSVVNAPFGRLSQYTHFPNAQSINADPRFKKVFAKLDLIGGPTPEAPSFFYQEIHDELAIIKPVDELVTANCAHGATIDYYRAPVGEHVTGAAAYIPPALLYLEQRFAGNSAPNTCPTND